MLISSIKLAEDRINELQNEIKQLKTANSSVKQRSSEEVEQMKETVKFHQFNSELCRLQVADLEERSRQLQERFDLVNTACGRLLKGKDELSTISRTCLEYMDTRCKQIKITVLITDNRQSDSFVNSRKTEQSDSEQHFSDSNSSCECCAVVKAFYGVCMPK